MSYHSTLHIVPAIAPALFSRAKKFDSLLVNGIDQACHGAHVFSVKILGPIDDSIYRAEQVAVS